MEKHQGQFSVIGEMEKYQGQFSEMEKHHVQFMAKWKNTNDNSWRNGKIPWEIPGSLRVTVTCGLGHFLLHFILD